MSLWFRVFEMSYWLKIVHWHFQYKKHEETSPNWRESHTFHKETWNKENRKESGLMLMTRISIRFIVKIQHTKALSSLRHFFSILIETSKTSFNLSNFKLSSKVWRQREQFFVLICICLTKLFNCSFCFGFNPKFNSISSSYPRGKTRGRRRGALKSKVSCICLISCSIGESIFWTSQR